MKVKFWLMMALLLCSWGYSWCGEFVDSAAKKRFRTEQLLTAHTTQIDTSFPYYQNRSVESIASEIEVNGFNGVYYFVIYKDGINKELIQKLQRRNISVALMTLPAMVYPSEETLEQILPPNWREWLVEFTDDSMSMYRFIGFNYPEYIEWYKKYLNEILLENNFDGFTFAEVMYPITDGPAREVVFYGDVSRNFQQSFMKATNSRSFPDFTNPNSPNYFKRNRELYQKLVDYRVEVINNFYNEIINGEGGARSVVPQIKFATWTLGINIPDGVEKLREWEGNDISSMMKLVKPDIHFIQTHAPDWSNPELSPTYPLDYAPFFEEIRQSNPNVKVAMQADLGSLTATRRSPFWCKIFYKSCRQAGVDTSTYYEFGLRWTIYNSPPKLCKIEGEGKEFRLCFDQRLGESSAQTMLNRQIGESKIVSAVVDGSILIIQFDQPIDELYLSDIDTSGVCDDPKVRFNDPTHKINYAD